MTVTDNLLVLEKAGLISLAAVRPEPEFTFRHALVQQAAYNTYIKAQRRRVHQVIAEVLEEAQPDPSLPAAQPADLAYHYFEAGQWAKAGAYARQAGERAQARYASREACQHFSLALEAAQRAGQPPSLELLRARGLAYEVLGQFDNAQADYAAALNQARAAGDWQDEWRVVLDLGLLWSSRDYARTGAYYRQALQLAQGRGDEAMLAHSLNRLGNWHFNAGENVAALKRHRQALAIFERLGQKPGLAETYDLLGMTETVLGQLRQGRADYERAIGLFREQDDRLGLTSSLATLTEHAPSLYTDTAALTLSATEGLELGRQAVEIARQIGARVSEAYALNSLANLLVSQGDYAAALATVQAALKIADEIGHRQWQTFARNVYGAACLDLLLFDEARRLVEPAYVMAGEIASALWIAGTSAVLALIHIAQNELPEAEAFLARPTRAQTGLNLHERVLTVARVELALAQGNPRHALALVQQLIDTAPELEPGQVISRLWHLRGRALARLDRHDEALADLQAAAAGSISRGTRPQTWRIQADLAGLYTALGHHPEAEAARAAARVVVELLAAGVSVAGWREHFLAQALRQIERKD